MPRPFLILILFFIAGTSSAQFFSGELLYETTFKAKKPDINLDSLKATPIAPTITYVITDGYYKSTYSRDGELVYAYTYHPDTKRMFDEVAERPYITFRDARKWESTVIRTRIYRDSIKEIAGQPCFMVERIHPDRIDYTYYAKDLKINADSFEGHAVADWYNSIKEVDGALSLGSISEYATHIQFDLVTKVTPRKVKRAEFTLPENKPIVASTEALDTPAELLPLTQAAISCYQEKMSTAMAKTGAEPLASYIGLIVKTDGSADFFEPYEEDAAGLYVTAIDVLKTCGITFTPGTIDGKPVDSFMYVPVQFVR